MTTTDEVEAPTSSRVLFGPQERPDEQLARALEDRELLGPLRNATRAVVAAGQGAIARELARAIAELLNVDLVELILAGWRKHQLLIAAARRTVETPGSREVVELATHSITSIHQPYIDFVVDSVRIFTMRFELRCEFRVEGLIGTVSEGRLVDLHAGTCDVTASLASEGVQIARGERQFTLPRVIDMGEGVSLLRAVGAAPETASG
jgi:hypothetical protein